MVDSSSKKIASLPPQDLVRRDEDESRNLLLIQEEALWKFASFFPYLCQGDAEAKRLYVEWLGQQSSAFREAWPAFDASTEPKPMAPLGFVQAILGLIEANRLTIPSTEQAFRRPDAESTSHQDQAVQIFHQDDALPWLRHVCLEVIGRLTETQWSHQRLQDTARRQTYNLAYGLTHEINNPLANISARAQLLLASTQNPSDRKTLATIIDQTDRAHEMLAELMLAVQVPKCQPAPWELRSWFESQTATFLALCDKAGLQLHISLPSRPLHSWFDADDLKEILLIATRNAIEACRPGDSLAWQIEYPSEREWQLKIIDNGPGLPHAKLEQIWDLYYSGREAGRGLGLGLAKLRRIVERNGGTVEAQSAPHAGFQLEIHFPVRANTSQ